MRPQAIVMLIDNHDSIAAYDWYFSLSKAQHALEKAQKKDKDGFYTLIKEDGGFSSTTDVIARMIYFGEYIGTSEDPFRKSFLNLSDKERKELADKYDIPENIIDSGARIERDVIERRRGYLCNYDEHTKAIMRKWLPRFLLKRIFY